MIDSKTRKECQDFLGTNQNILVEEELAEVIDKWYFDWKENIADWNSRTTLFGLAKEDLKRRIEVYPFR